MAPWGYKLGLGLRMGLGVKLRIGLGVRIRAKDRVGGCYD